VDAGASGKGRKSCCRRVAHGPRPRHVGVPPRRPNSQMTHFGARRLRTYQPGPAFVVSSASQRWACPRTANRRPPGSRVTFRPYAYPPPLREAGSNPDLINGGQPVGGRHAVVPMNVLVVVRHRRKQGGVGWCCRSGPRWCPHPSSRPIGSRAEAFFKITTYDAIVADCTVQLRASQQASIMRADPDKTSRQATVEAVNACRSRGTPSYTCGAAPVIFNAGMFPRLPRRCSLRRSRKRHVRGTTLWR
jgi:hypothetical protein